MIGYNIKVPVVSQLIAGALDSHYRVLVEINFNYFISFLSLCIDAPAADSASLNLLLLVNKISSCSLVQERVLFFNFSTSALQLKNYIYTQTNAV